MSFHELVAAPRKQNSPRQTNITEISDSFLPPISIDRAKIEEHNAEGLKVSLNLSMNMQSSDYNSAATRKLLKLRILLLDDITQFNSVSTPGTVQNFSGVITDLSLDEFTNNNYNQQLYNLKKQIFINKKTTFLGIVAYVYSPDGGNDSSMQVSSNLMEISSSIEGQRAAMILLENDIISGATYYYTRSNNTVWFGPVHQMENGTFMTGFEHKDESEVVSQNTINALKVQDFRLENSLNSLDISFAEKKDEQYPELSTGLNVTQGKLLPNKSNSMFSDFFISKDEMGNCRFFFSLDWRRMILSNSPYQQILKKNSNSIQELMRLCKIQSLKLFRVREKENLVNRNKKIFSPQQKNKKFYPNFVDELVVQTRDSDNGFLVTTTTDNDLSNSVLELSLGLDNGNKIRHFSGVDQQISQKEEGLFSYKIRLDVLDYSEQIIKSKINLLRSSITSLTQYYNQAVYFKVTDNPDVKNFDSNLQFFSVDFARRFDTTQLDQIIGNFSSTLSFFSVLDISNSAVVISNYLKSYLYPSIASPDSITFAINLMTNTLKRIEDNVNTISRKIVPSTKQQNDSQVKINPPERIKTFVVEKTFAELFNANEKSNSGFDFFNTTDSNSSIGLKQITRSDLETTQRNEIGLFYSGAPSAPGLDSDGRPNQKDRPNSINLTQPTNVYFTPQKIYSNGHIIDVSNSNTKEYLGVITRRDLHSTTHSSNSKNISMFLNDKFGLQVVTTDNENVNSDLRSTSNNQEKASNVARNNKIVDQSFETLYEIRKFITNDISKQEYTILNEADPQLSKKLSDYDINNKDSLIRKNLNKNSNNKNNTMVNAPFQVKRLIFNSYLSQDVLKRTQEEILSNLDDSKNYSYFVYRTQTINKLMFFNGYELDDNGDPILKKPMWVSVLDQPNLLSNLNLKLCKSIPFEDESLNIKRQKMFDLPTYDEYFLISGGGS